MIFGSGKSYFSDGVTTVNLTHSTTDLIGFENQDRVFRSIITGKKTHVFTGDYTEFTVRDLLFKYSSPTTQYQSLEGLVDTTLTFYYLGSTVVTLCYVYSVKPGYLFGKIHYDLALIRCLPTRYLWIQQPILTESAIPILTEDGKLIYTEGVSL